MTNTITNTRILNGPRTVIQYFNLVSDGTNETDTVVYDSSAVAAAYGKADPLTSTIKKVYFTSAGSGLLVRLEWDATTDVGALSLPKFTGLKLDFTSFGGLPNQGGAGKTGDITITTGSLTSGDSFTLILVVDPGYV